MKYDPAVGPTVTLQVAEQEHIFEHVRLNAPYATRLCLADAKLGQRVAVCGAGPTLAAVAAAALEQVDEVWACNSALTYMRAHGLRVTHGVTIDQTLAMLDPEEWGQTWDVEYLLATCVNPQLVAHLRRAARRLRFFHSYIGLPNPAGWTAPEAEPGLTYEMALYTRLGLYETSVLVGHGLNSVPRAVCLALVMGFAEVDVYGADCACAVEGASMPPHDPVAYRAWLRGLQFYADGRPASWYGEDAAFAQAVIDGRRWTTRPDMVMSALHLLDLARAFPGRVRLHGDTLPNALAPHLDDPAFMEKLPRLAADGTVSNFGVAGVLPDAPLEQPPRALRLAYAGQGTVTPPAEPFTVNED